LAENAVPEILIWAAVITAFAMSRIAEYRVHTGNYSLLIDAGAEELQPRFMKQYYRLTLLIVPFAMIEHFAYETPIFKEMLIGGLFFMAFGLSLRLWSIHVLGTFWSMRCLSLRGITKVKAGPYRFFNNPEYLSRMFDAVGICLIFGAQVTGLTCLTLLTMMTLKIATVEKRQIREVGESGI
jgi:methyltransferase